MSDNNPLISIITPNYNCSQYIIETIESVLAQTYKDWEMIIVDDCSTDGSYDIALKYAKNDSRIKIYRMERNGGAAVCRNKGIELSQGEYLAFLDSDDIWMPEKLEKQLKFMQENDCDFSFTEYEHVDEEGRALGIKARVIKRLTYRKMLFHCYPGCLTVMYRQNLVGKIYGENISKNNDYALFLQILKHTKNAMGITENLARYRIRRNSISRKRLAMLKPYITILHDYEHLNIFFTFFCVLTHVFIRTLFKYEYKKNITNKN